MVGNKTTMDEKFRNYETVIELMPISGHKSKHRLTTDANMFA